MNEGQRMSDERLEAKLRSLPELDPPAHLLTRVMEQVAATEGSDAGRIPVGQTVAATVAVAAMVVFVAVYYASTSVELLRNGLDVVMRTVHFVSDSSVTVMAGAWASAAKLLVVVSAFGTVFRTLAATIGSEFGSFIITAAIATVALQLSLFVIVGGRQGTG